MEKDKSKFDDEYIVLMVGDMGTGKTSLLMKAVYGKVRSR